MKILSKSNLSLLAIITVLGFSSCKKDAVSPTENYACSGMKTITASHPKGTKLQEIMDRYTDKGLPGIALLIEDSSGIWAGSSGYADIENGTPFTPCHVSKVASITKFMMGSMVLKLQEEGKININHSISDYLPAEVIERVENAEKVTIKQLMNHTTGIYDIITDSEFYLSILNNPNKQWEGMDLIEFVYDKPAEDRAGGKGNYSNTNTLLLSLVVEGATGTEHEDLLKSRVIDELELKSTYYHYHDELPDNTAQGYYDLYNSGNITNISNYITGNGNGYNGIYSNVFDLNRFLNAAVVDKTLLSPASMDTLMTFVPTHDENIDYGPGIMRRFKHLVPTYALGHTGRDLGYSADLFYFPDSETNMAFLVNYGTDATSNLQPIFNEFEKEVIAEVVR